MKYTQIQERKKEKINKNKQKKNRITVSILGIFSYYKMIKKVANISYISKRCKKEK